MHQDESPLWCPSNKSTRYDTLNHSCYPRIPPINLTLVDLHPYWFHRPIQSQTWRHVDEIHNIFEAIIDVADAFQKSSVGSGRKITFIEWICVLSYDGAWSSPSSKCENILIDNMILEILSNLSFEVSLITIVGNIGCYSISCPYLFPQFLRLLLFSLCLCPQFIVRTWSQRFFLRLRFLFDYRQGNIDGGVSARSTRSTKGLMGGMSWSIGGPASLETLAGG